MVGLRVRLLRARACAERIAVFFYRALAPSRAARGQFDSLLRFGSFPEPFLVGSERRARVWRRNRVEQVIREDLRDLSRLPDLSRVCNPHPAEESKARTGCGVDSNR
jgi:predicted AAA+ superfamily ATPase